MLININNEQSLKKIDEEKIKKICEHVIINEYKDDDFELNLLITDNERISYFNENYRHKSEPTDVLSFEYGLEESVIGDIVISVETIETQAPLFNNSFEQEFYYILIHGLLHILGYDHVDDEENKKIMFNKQDEYFKTLIEEG